MNKSLVPLILFLMGYLQLSLMLSLQIIPERAEIHSANDKYVQNLFINVRKLGRKGDYIVNLNFTLVYDVGYNVTMDILFFEHLHNEYRRSFVEMHFNLCHLINKDQLLGIAVRNAGVVICPMKAGVYALTNMSIPSMEHFPYVWPFERARVMGTFTNPKTGVFLANGSVYFFFKQLKT